MKRLNIDIETYSEADLMKSGVYKYVDRSSGFEVLLFGYAVDGGTVSLTNAKRDSNISAKGGESL